jgi:hypothetical protein
MKAIRKDGGRLRAPRGRCAECGFSFRLTRGGLLYAHELFGFDERHYCPGGGRAPWKKGTTRPPEVTP